MSASTIHSKHHMKARRRGRNTNAGCKTCKIRRKRCDETRPACLRCSTTGRSCDFVGSDTYVLGTTSQHGSQHSYWSVYSPRLIGSAPNLLHLADPIERGHFDYFLSECTKEFSSFFNAVLWQHLVVQAAYSEPFILHAVLAISSLRRAQIYEISMVPTLEPSSVAEYTTRKYTMALRILRQRLRDNMVDWKLTALASLVFLAIEVLQGHEQEALVHIRSGEAILKSLGCCNSSSQQSLRNSKSSFTQAETNHDTVSDDIIAAFTRLSIEEELFIGASSPNSATLPALPTHFECVSAAQTALNSIMVAMFSFFRRNGNEFFKTLRFAPLPNNILEDFCQIRTTLQSWYTIFNELTPSKSSNSHDNMTINILLVYYHVTSIRLSTYFHYSELIYDQYYTQFKFIMKLLSEVLVQQSTLSNSTGPCFTLDIAMAQPLFFVARKCRDLQLRKRAIKEMEKVGRKGVYTGRNIAKIAKWIVCVEHGLEDTDGFVPEEKRLGDVHFEFHCGRRIGMVTAKRRMPDGEFEVLMENLCLS